MPAFFCHPDRLAPNWEGFNVQLTTNGATVIITDGKWHWWKQKTAPSSINPNKLKTRQSHKIDDETLIMTCFWEKFIFNVAMNYILGNYKKILLLNINLGNWTNALRSFPISRMRGSNLSEWAIHRYTEGLVIILALAGWPIEAHSSCCSLCKRST